jgi:multidrug efflux pump
MTSMAFVMGVTPLVLATGAGAAGRHSIGTGVFGGMLAETFLAIFFTPVFFVLNRKLAALVSRRRSTGVGPVPARSSTSGGS